jgi:catechol 2,3-dioxygenase-like lactoylglutathione lyase family enzyme
VVATGNGVNVDFMDKEAMISTQHYAFLVSEAEFEQVLGRVLQSGLQYWADPARTKAGEINDRDGGSGVYFEDPNGHLLEVITRRYGSGGWNS